MTSDDSELDFEFKLREKEEELELGTVTLQIRFTSLSDEWKYYEGHNITNYY